MAKNVSKLGEDGKVSIRYLNLPIASCPLNAKHTVEADAADCGLTAQDSSVRGLFCTVAGMREGNQ